MCTYMKWNPSIYLYTCMHVYLKHVLTILEHQRCTVSHTITNEAVKDKTSIHNICISCLLYIAMQCLNNLNMQFLI